MCSSPKIQWISEQSFLFVVSKQSQSLMRTQMTECIYIQLFCSGKCSADVTPSPSPPPSPQENKS